jgi:hypothetical protein
MRWCGIIRSCGSHKTFDICSTNFTISSTYNNKKQSADYVYLVFIYRYILFLFNLQGDNGSYRTYSIIDSTKFCKLK